MMCQVCDASGLIENRFSHCPPSGQLLTYLSVVLNDRLVAYGFITDGHQIGFAKGFIENGEKCFLRSKLMLITELASIQGLLGYFRASRVDFGLPPSMVGKYTVGRRVGAGATSYVFAGDDPDGRRQSSCSQNGHRGSSGRDGA